MNTYKKYIIGAGVVLGAIGGYFYWQEVGCLSGTCLISSVWYNSTAYGAIMGGMLVSLVLPKNEKSEINDFENER